MARSTREAITTAAVELLRRNGYAAVGMQQLAKASGAPIGSIYHHFPGGKREVVGTALVEAGDAYGTLLISLLIDHDDLGAAIRQAFDEAAQVMESASFINMCPVGTVAGEVADVEDDLRTTAASVFDQWTVAGVDHLTARSVDPDIARAAVLTVIATLEGAFVMARTTRDVGVLRTAGDVVATRFDGVVIGPGSAVGVPAPTFKNK